MRGLIFRTILIGTMGSSVMRLLPARRIGTDSDEQDLIRAARRGDRIAFDHLVARHKEAVRRFLARRVPAHEVDDVYQETWVAAWEHFNKFSGSSRFRTWLLAVCSHKVQDHWRVSDRHPVSAATDDFEGMAGYTQAEFGIVELRESVRSVWNALTPAQQELLDLYYGAELTLAEISKLLNRNLNTVKYQFYRAHEEAARVLTPELLESLRDKEQTS